jgi:hypothetical protein
VGTKTIFTPGTKVLVKLGAQWHEAVVIRITTSRDCGTTYTVSTDSEPSISQNAEYLTEIKHEPKFSVGQDVVFVSIVFVSSPKKNLHRVRERRYVAGGWEYMMFDGPTFYKEETLSAPPVVPASQPPRFQPGDHVRTPEGDKGTVAKCSTTYHDSSTWSTTYTVRRSFLNPDSIPHYTTREDGYAEHELKPWVERTFNLGDVVRTPSGAVGTVETAVYESSQETTYVVKLKKIYWTRPYYEDHSFKASELTLFAPTDCSSLTSRVDESTRQIEDLMDRVEALEVKAHSRAFARFRIMDSVALNGHKMEVVSCTAINGRFTYMLLDKTANAFFAAAEEILSPWLEQKP